MQKLNVLIQKVCFTIKCEQTPPPPTPHHLLSLLHPSYAPVSLVSLLSTSVSPPATVFQLLFLHLLLEGDTPYTHTPLTLYKQLMFETRVERDGEKKANKRNEKMHSSKAKEIEK